MVGAARVPARRKNATWGKMGNHGHAWVENPPYTGARRKTPARRAGSFPLGSRRRRGVLCTPADPTGSSPYVAGGRKATNSRMANCAKQSQSAAGRTMANCRSGEELRTDMAVTAAGKTKPICPAKRFACLRRASVPARLKKSCGDARPPIKSGAGSTKKRLTASLQTRRTKPISGWGQSGLSNGRERSCV
jgi:hypothetical protein